MLYHRVTRGKENVTLRYNSRSFHGPSIGGIVNKGFILLDVYTFTRDTDRYIRGEIGHAEYAKSIGEMALGYVLPWPLNAAYGAYQLGKFAGTWAAQNLVDAYRRGDPIARALVDWMRRNGFINANDPTFLAFAETPPPRVGGARSIVLLEGQFVPVSVGLWAAQTGETLVRLGARDLDEDLSALVVPVWPGLNTVDLAPSLLAGLAPGSYRVTAEDVDGSNQSALLAVVVRPADQQGGETPSGIGDPAPEPASAQAEPTISDLALVAEVIDTRLRRTDLPWSRFDRPQTLLQGEPQSGEAIGRWIWSEDPLWPTHESGGDGPPLHYHLFTETSFVAPGENLVQYVWLDPSDPPEQIVLQVYDQNLAANHRFTMGADLIAQSDRSGTGFVFGGDLPSTGQWWRLRIPVAEIGLSGREIAGLGFASAGGRVLWGPSRLSGGDDTSPRLTAAGGLDTRGAAETELSLGVSVPAAGRLRVYVEVAEDETQTPRRTDVFDGAVHPGNRTFRWVGDAIALTGGEAVVELQTPDGAVQTARQSLGGTTGLVANILFPPEGAVGRQTVPIFGQAGGDGFVSYTVDYRPRGAGDAAWETLATGSEPSVVTAEEVDARIYRILGQQLRGTIYGNLASLNTGSALHRFEFARAQPTLPTGWIDVRLTVTGEGGQDLTDQRSFRIGEVADGLSNSPIESVDGLARLELPTLALPAGMGTLSLDQASDQTILSGPQPIGPVYSVAPDGLELLAPATLSLQGDQSEAPPEAGDASAERSIVVSLRDGSWEVLPGGLSVRLDGLPSGARYYVSDLPPPQRPVRTGPLVPGFGAPAPGQFGMAAPMVLVDGPLDVTGPRILSFAHRASSFERHALILRHGTGSTYIPLGRHLSGMPRSIARTPLDLPADGTDRIAVIRIDTMLPPGTEALDRIDLVLTRAAAWRSLSAEAVDADAIALGAVGFGPPPNGEGVEWSLPDGALWGQESARPSEGPVRPSGEGIVAGILQDAGGVQIPWPLLVDSTPPELRVITPADGAVSSDLVLEFAVEDTGAGLDPSSLAVEVAGVSIPQDALVIGRGTVEVRLADFADAFESDDEGRLSATVRARDLYGNEAEALSWRWTYRPEAQTLGSARQLSTLGGQAPTWSPDGTQLLHLAERDGAVRIVRRPLDPEAVVEVIETPFLPTSALDVDPSGRIVSGSASGVPYLLNPDGAWQALGAEGQDPSFATDGRILFGRGNELVAHDPATGAEDILCRAVPGATVERPLADGVGGIVFTQAIYHHTIWRCDPSTGRLTALSAEPDSPDTRDVDPAPSGGGSVTYARNNGLGGLWQLSPSGSVSVPLLPPEFTTARAPRLSPDGRTLAFVSSVTGREEVWLLDLGESLSFSVFPACVAPGVTESMALDLPATATVATVRFVASDGSVVAERDAVEDGRITVPDSLIAGPAFVEVTLASDLVARHPITVDSTQPDIVLTDTATGEAISDPRALTDGRLNVTAVDADGPLSRVSLLGADGQVLDLSPGPILDIATLPLGASLEVVDLAGNRRVLPLRPTEAAAPETNTEPAPASSGPIAPDEQGGAAPDDASGVPWVWILLGVGLVGGVGGYVAARRRVT